ncbi:MAG: hypothetical protein ACK40X_00985 [Armatimonadota bacterium]
MEQKAVIWLIANKKTALASVGFGEQIWTSEQQKDIIGGYEKGKALSPKTEKTTRKAKEAAKEKPLSGKKLARI